MRYHGPIESLDLAKQISSSLFSLSGLDETPIPCYSMLSMLSMLGSKNYCHGPFVIDDVAHFCSFLTALGRGRRGGSLAT